MRTRVAMFRAETEPAVLDLIFQVTGYPTGEALQEYEAIEQWPTFSHIQTAAQNSFLARYGSGKTKYFDAVALDLLERLLDVNPARRISATDALAHEFFRDPVTPAQYVSPALCPRVVDDCQCGWLTGRLLSPYCDDLLSVCRLPAITIAPVTEWMEQERARADHELQKQRYLERKEHQRLESQQQAHAQPVVQPVPPKPKVPPHQQLMKAQGDNKVVNRYKIIKRDNNQEK
jgi:serine/threonine protein kinase